MQMQGPSISLESGELSIKLAYGSVSLLDREALSVPSVHALGPFINIILNSKSALRRQVHERLIIHTYKISPSR